MYDVVQVESTDRDTSDTTSSGAVLDIRNVFNATGRLPPFCPSEHPQPSATLKVLLLALTLDRNVSRGRFLILGWPAPSGDAAYPYFKRYTKKYRLEGVAMSYVLRFAILLQRRLRCSSETQILDAERCLFDDVTDPSPSVAEVDRSFDCVAVATTRWCSRFCLKPQLTEDQFLWLVQFFGGLPKWYYNWQPDRLEPV